MLSLGLPLIILASMITMPIGTIIQNKLAESRISQYIAAEKMQILISSSICVLGTFLATSDLFLSLSDCGHVKLAIFTTTFAISFGICNGSGYTIPLKICWELFPNQKGMVTGVISCGFGVGSFLFGIISTMLINPNND